MKKSILLIAVMLFSGLCANAANWQPMYTDFPGLSMYVDMDSFKPINNDECYYAVKYVLNNNPEKIVYLKSNVRTNYLGIITTDTFTEGRYRPNATFADPHVYMKPLNENSFLKSAHAYVATLMPEEVKVANKNFPAVSHHAAGENTYVSYNANFDRDIQGYVAVASELLNANWEPPFSGRNSRGIVKVSIGSDGSLLNCDFIESTGDEITDRSIISAVEKTVPYPKFPASAGSVHALDFQFVFDYDLMHKTVVY